MIKYLPGQVNTGKLIAKSVVTKPVNGKSVTTFKLAINTKVKNDEGKYVPKMKKDAAGVEKDVVAFIQFEAWGDANIVRIEQAFNNKCLTVIEYDVEENNYEKDGRTVYNDKRTVKFIKNYVYESGQFLLLPVGNDDNTNNDDVPY